MKPQYFSLFLLLLPFASFSQWTTETGQCHTMVPPHRRDVQSVGTSDGKT